MDRMGGDLTAADRQNLMRRRLWRENPEPFEAVLKILFEADPMGICVEENRDRRTEYAPEADTILARLPEANSLEETRRIVHEEFLRWFGVDTTKKQIYAGIALAIWESHGGF